MAMHKDLIFSSPWASRFGSLQVVQRKRPEQDSDQEEVPFAGCVPCWAKKACLGEQNPQETVQTDHSEGKGFVSHKALM